MASSYGFTASGPSLSGTKTFNTPTDQDLQDILDWAGEAYKSVVDELYNTPPVPGFIPTNAQKGIALATATMRAWNEAVIKRKHDSSLASVPVPPPGNWN
jgi:hypothetical protein